MGFVDIDVGGVIDSAMEGLNNLFTSDAERLEFKDRLEQRLHLRLQGQVEINKIEAKHPSLFVAGWRPAMGWTCVSGLAYEFVLRPLLEWINISISMLLGTAVPSMPQLNAEQLIGLVVALLGIAGYRTYEKRNDKARSN